MNKKSINRKFLPALILLFAFLILAASRADALVKIVSTYIDMLGNSIYNVNNLNSTGWINGTSINGTYYGNGANLLSINTYNATYDAKAGTGSCNAGQYASATTTSGVTCGVPIRTLLSSTTLASPANSITVSYTPTNYNNIEYEVFILIFNSTSTIEFQLDSDTAANYAWSKLVAATTSTGVSATYCLMDTTASALKRLFHMHVLEGATTSAKLVSWEGGTLAATAATAPLFVQGVCHWNNTASVVNTVKVLTTTATSFFNTGSYVKVYGG